MKKRHAPLTIFLGCTAVILLSALVAWRSSAVSLRDTFEFGPITNTYAFFIAMGLFWCVLLAVLYLFSLRKLKTDTVIVFSLLIFITLLYLNILREHYEFGDYKSYLHAANSILAGEPFPKRYIYPPLWASFLSKILMIGGEKGATLACFTLNQLSIVGFFILGVLFLSRCGLSKTLSSLLTFTFMLINVPILRNIVYVQVNLLLLDLILAAVLLFGRSNSGSALLLALATHLKVVPILFVPLFLVRKQYRWAIYYGIFGLAIVGLTVWLDGYSYYFDFYHNLKALQFSDVRSASVFGFLVKTNDLLNIGLPAYLLFNVVRVGLVVWIYALAWVSIRRRVFSRLEDPAANRVINGIIPLFFLMPAVSPTVWVHHMVVLILPSLLIFLHMPDKKRMLTWLAVHSSVFVLPVFDWYPLSYVRLAGWIMMLVLLHKAVFAKQPEWVARIERFIAETIKRGQQEFSSS